MARKDKKGYNLRKGESQRKDGRYSYRYMDPTGVRRTIYATDLKELREKEKSINRELEEGIRVNPESKNMTVEQLFRIYISTRTLKANSRCHYEYIWSCYISNELEEMKVVQVKPCLLYTSKYLVEVESGFPSSQLCSECGYIKMDLTLAERSWTCPECGVHHDRDLNAALNLKREGKRLLSA